MFLMNYEDGKGWHNPRIEPYAPFTMDPACCVLHYGQSIFDGLKAFRGPTEQVRLFRLPDHARRVNRSAHYLCIPELDPAMVEESIRALVKIDQRWVPSKPGTSLYIRPTVIATETFLGVHPSNSYLYYVIVGPVGAYYKEGMNPVRILASDTATSAPSKAASARQKQPATMPRPCSAPRSRRKPATPRCCGSTASSTNTSTRSAP